MTDAAPHISILETVFPVVATEPGHQGELARPDFFGTAFAVAPGIFMTAEHVVREAVLHGQLTLAGPSTQAMMGGVKVDAWETWPERDVALLYCAARGRTLLDTWLINRVQLLTDLSSFGYPHAVTRENEQDHFEVVFRGYKGHVVTTRGFDRLPDKPAVYEVSCPYPEGLSGAPVLLHREGQLVVVGIVIGSQTVRYGGVDSTVGIAMIADEIVELQSQRLGRSIGDGLRLDGAEVRFEVPEDDSYTAPESTTAD